MQQPLILRWHRNEADWLYVVITVWALIGTKYFPEIAFTTPALVVLVAATLAPMIFPMRRCTEISDSGQQIKKSWCVRNWKFSSATFTITEYYAVRVRWQPNRFSFTFITELVGHAGKFMTLIEYDGRSNIKKHFETAKAIRDQIANLTGLVVMEDPFAPRVEKWPD